eukprot:CAMPEP_0170566590 /NCGR_PEP_ID=MMETSP0211-20121228/79939_1 /TAXON_ID=311385 /ORGANISM="Pseudokeronopsis sp., Strain OXSARD2" /LENGTH=78 /DNA_ID=CAMNT_0010887815 /DNA_START=449 /DNA_END=685 /DNA_ORIENTATION=-
MRDVTSVMFRIKEVLKKLKINVHHPQNRLIKKQLSFWSFYSSEIQELDDLAYLTYQMLPTIVKDEEYETNLKDLNTLI